jgi:hypothetical protein
LVDKHLVTAPRPMVGVDLTTAIGLPNHTRHEESEHQQSAEGQHYGEICVASGTHTTSDHPTRTARGR